MPNTNRQDLVSENIVQLIFNQVKESIDKNTESIDKLTEATTILTRAIDNHPKETSEKVSLLGVKISGISTFMKIVFGVIVGLFTILTFIFGYFGIGLNTLGPEISKLTTNVETLKPLLEQLLNKP